MGYPVVTIWVDRVALLFPVPGGNGGAVWDGARTALFDLSFFVRQNFAT